MWGRPGLVSSVVAMAPYVGTGGDLCTNAFAPSVSFFEIAQKYLGDSTHPVKSTRLMQMMMQLSSAAAGTS